MPRHMFVCEECHGKCERVYECDECEVGDGCGRRHDWEPCHTCEGAGEIECADDDCQVCDEAEVVGREGVPCR